MVGDVLRTPNIFLAPKEKKKKTKIQNTFFMYGQFTDSEKGLNKGAVLGNLGPSGEGRQVAYFQRRIKRKGKRI